MKNVICIICFLLASGLILVHASSITVSEDITADTVWNVDTVFIESSITVNNGVTLAISEGTYVEFQGHYKLSIQGRLLAIGTESDTIVFTVADTTGFGNIDIPDGGWHGIRFSNTSEENDSSMISYCRLQFGKAVISPDDIDTVDEGHGAPVEQGSAIFVKNFSKVNIANCNIRNNKAIHDAAIYFENAGGKLISNTISYNEALDDAGAIRCTDNSSPIIMYNTITNNNSANNAGGIFLIENSSPLIAYNTIANNAANDDGGGIMVSMSSEPTIINNIISENHSMSDGGGICCWHCHPIIIGNAICDNEADSLGGGLCCTFDCNPIVTNNTICNNTANKGGGLSCKGNSEFAPANPIFTNCILYGNSASIGYQVYLHNDYSDPDFYFCNIEGGQVTFHGDGAGFYYNGEYEDNIDAIPLFVGTGDSPYYLQPESPCIDAGNPDTAGLDLPESDLTGSPRIDNGTIDIGAYEYRFDGIALFDNKIVPRIATLHQNFPNPFNPTTTILFDIIHSNDITLQIFNSKGRLVKTLINDNLESGQHSVIWDSKDEKGDAVPSGIYYYRLQVGEQNETLKLILLK